MKAMILAAGRGERMRPLTDERPKPLLHAGGQPLIVAVINTLVAAGFSDLVVNVSWLGDQVRSVLGDGEALEAHITYSPKPPGALGTGGGILNALPHLGEEHFLVVNGDVWCDYPFASLRRRQQMPAHLVLVDNPPQHADGDFELRTGIVGNGHSRRLTFSGIGVYHPTLFSDCTPGVFALAPLLRVAADRGQVSGEYFNGEWMDIGTPQRLQTLNRRLRQTPA